MNYTHNLQSLPFSCSKTYLMATAFAIGNILMPQLLHAVPMGGQTWLPIYFFTLIGAYLYGWRAGLLIAILSPLSAHMLFGMPALGALPAIMVKSVLLATFAGLAAARYKKVSIAIVAAVVLSYQFVGTLAEWGLTGSLISACRGLRTGIPGILLQIFAGYAALRAVSTRRP